MKTKTICQIIFFIFTLISCNSQTRVSQEENTNIINREPRFDGRFYPGNKEKLQQELTDYFSEAEKKVQNDVVALIVPHAGYVFSGGIAANSYAQLNPNQKYDNIFLLASSHTARFNGASIYNRGHYETPLGEVKVNLKLAHELIKSSDNITYLSAAHTNEHCLEVQLPFLQHLFKNDFQIVPIIIGDDDARQCKLLAEDLMPWFNKNNLFIISSDFSHYPKYADAIMADSVTADAISSNSADALIEALKENKNKRIPGLATSMCGWSAGLTLLYMTERDPLIEIRNIKYCNSGDNQYGDKTRVVGYWSIAFSKNSQNKSEEPFRLLEDDKSALLKISENTLSEYINDNTRPEYKKEDFSSSLCTHCGAFISLYYKGGLRGCIGTFKAGKPLFENVQDMTIAAATKDRRFTPVTKSELENISIEISVLTPLQQIKDTSEIVLGKHGIYIKKGSRSGTFLPQVATKTGWNLEEFLGHCAKSKAHLGWDGWKEAEIYTYEAIIFNNKKSK